MSIPIAIKILLAMSMIGLIITSASFSRIGVSMVNYNLVKRGSFLSTCKVIDHVITINRGECIISSVEQCNLGLYRRDIGSTSCSMLELDVLRSTSPLDSLTRRFTFSTDPGVYYSLQEYEEFIEMYKRDPRLDYIVLLTFFCFFSVSVIVLIGYVVMKYRKDRTVEYEEEMESSK